METLKMKKQNFNISIKDIDKGYIPQNVKGYVFSYGGLNFGVFNAIENDFILFGSDDKKFIVSELGSGLEIAKNFKFKKDITINNLFGDNHFNKIKNAIEKMKTTYFYYKNNYINKCMNDYEFLKSITQNKINEEVSS